MDRCWPGFRDESRELSGLGKIGWCLEIHDLLISKYVAGRPKDLDYAREAIRHALVDASELHARLREAPLPEARRAEIAAAIDADVRAAAAPRP